MSPATHGKIAAVAVFISVLAIAISIQAWSQTRQNACVRRGGVPVVTWEGWSVDCTTRGGR